MAIELPNIAAVMSVVVFLIAFSFGLLVVECVLVFTYDCGTGDGACISNGLALSHAVFSAIFESAMITFISAASSIFTEASSI